VEERVAALVRISTRLESLIEQLQLTREQIAAGADEEGPDAYRALHAEAVKYRWYLEVQRESMGIRNHRRLDEFYRVPALDI
jgi:hypothetical protein